MRWFLIIIWGFLFLYGCKDDKSVNDAQQVQFNKADYYQKVDTMPMPVGGMQAILAKIVYPPEAQTKGIEGKILVQAFIDEKGNVAKSEVIKGADSLLDKAALEAINQVKFTPGYEKGKPVKTQVVIPVVFKLDGHGKKETGKFEKKGDYYLNAPEMPQILGGINELVSRIKYPDAEKKSGVQGTVYIKLSIDEKGNIEKKEIIKGVNKNLDKAALDALEGLKFTPGKVDSKNVKTMITLPITFRLQ